MQAELPPRRGGFIITGAALPPRPVQKKENDKIRVIGQMVSDTAVIAAEKTEYAARAFFTFSKGRLLSSLKKAARTAFCMLCACAFFRIFTVGTAVYSGENRIAVTQSEKEYSKAQKSFFDISGENTSFYTTAYIYPRTKLESKNTLSDKMLLSSPEYAKGYALYANGKRLYIAKEMKSAKNALAEYIKNCTSEGELKSVSKVKIKPCVGKKAEMLSEKECYEKLSKSNAVEVISTYISDSSENIPYETEIMRDDTLFIGETVTENAGSEGVRETKKLQTFKNGLLQSEEVFSQNVTAQPVKCVLRKGTKEKNIEETGVKYPLTGKLSSPFGPRWGRNHDGIDIAVPEGTKVKAAECGIVSYVSENAGGYGKFIRIDHGYNMQTAYAHLSEINVKKGDEVACGQVIALSGNTGNSTGPHLHFEVVKNGTRTDPMPYLK